MDLGIAGRTALVLGAGGGLGRAIARALAREGARVALADIDETALAATAADLSALGAPHLARRWNLGRLDEADGHLAAIGEALGPVDILVNNTGGPPPSLAAGVPPETWTAQFQAMVLSVIALTDKVLPGMRERGFGRIVNIGSIHSLVASPFKSAYVAAKHGLVGFSKVIALETADADITVNTICPTYVKTPLVDRQIADQARTRGIPEAEVVRQVMLKPMPKGVFISFEELAGITAFLMSPVARNITGHTIDVDGGWTVQ